MSKVISLNVSDLMNEGPTTGSAGLDFTALPASSPVERCASRIAPIAHSAGSLAKLRMNATKFQMSSGVSV